MSFICIILYRIVPVRHNLFSCRRPALWLAIHIVPFEKEGRFLLKCEGAGSLFISSVGAIHLKELANGEQYTVDIGHMIAFDSSIQYSVERSAGWKSTLSGEGGLVCKLVGPGRFYMQTRSDAFVSRRSKLPSRSN